MAHLKVGSAAEAGAPYPGPAGEQLWYVSTVASLSLPVCSGKVLACLFLTERVLMQQKHPDSSAFLFMTCWPPVNTIRSKGGHKGHVRRTQLHQLQREMQNHWQITA